MVGKLIFSWNASPIFGVLPADYNDRDYYSSHWTRFHRPLHLHDYDGWIGAAKITRSQFYRYKGREYVLAARTLGASDPRIIFKHILPNALGTIITRVILSIPSVIFLEVNLSFLGFGIGNGQVLKIGPITLTGTSIGVILNDGQQQIFAGNLWLVIAPTIIVSILMITFNMFGNALRDALNPQLRGS